MLYIYIQYLYMIFLMLFWIITFLKPRSSSSEVLYKIDVLKILQNSLKTPVFNFIKTETPEQVFFYDFCKIVKNTYLVDHLLTDGSENGSIKSNNTVRSLSKVFLLYRSAGFLVTLNIICYSKKIIRSS